MLDSAAYKTADNVFKLLKLSTSREVFAEFLKRHDAPHSAANWDEVFTKRVVPGLEDGKFTITDLRNLLRETEEHGRQHIFLYECSAEHAAVILGQKRVQKVAAEAGVAELLSEPLELELPNEPRLVDIRFENQCLIVKQVETRELQKLYSEQREDNALIKKYAIEKRRAVNLAKLHPDGFLEIRISKQDNSSRYQENIAKFVGSIDKIIPFNVFKPIILSMAKGNLLKNQDALKDKVRFVLSEAKNDFGMRMNVSSSSQQDNVLDDAGAKQGLDAFIKNGGQIDRSNFYFVISDDEPTREVHVLLAGELNEFAIPPSCNAVDYDYVCNQIRQLNQAIPA